MVAQAPPIEEVIPKFHEFIQGGVLVAHHAQFDLGFITWEFEKLHLGLPAVPVVCSSLLSRRLIPETGNHRLKTLVEYLKIDGGTAHRAFDDARACLEVALYCFNKLGPETTFERIIQQMGVELCWQRFSLADLETNNNGGLLLQAIEQGLELNLAYAGGSRPGKLRRVRPEGIVRNVDGDYLVAQENGQNVAKRYLLAKIQKVSLLTGLN
jgi:DNA polymerase-3 subunit epsilon